MAIPKGLSQPRLWVLPVDQVYDVPRCLKKQWGLILTFTTLSCTYSELFDLCCSLRSLTATIEKSLRPWTHTPGYPTMRSTTSCQETRPSRAGLYTASSKLVPHEVQPVTPKEFTRRRTNPTRQRTHHIADLQARTYRQHNGDFRWTTQ